MRILRNNLTDFKTVLLILAVLILGLSHLGMSEIVREQVSKESSLSEGLLGVQGEPPPGPRRAAGGKKESKRGGSLEPPGLVKIVAPTSGWSGDRLIQLDAHVGDPAIRFAYLIENGVERMVRVKNSRVSEKLVLSPGSNQIVVQVREPESGRLHSDHVVLYSNVPKKDIKIILTWDTDGTDIDLHVLNPDNEDCYYGNQETKQGGRLDVDITDGYGPEVFTQANAVSGDYQVKTHYYSSNNHPQTLIKVQVILFEGTDMEKRYRFDKVLVKTDDEFLVGTFNVKTLEGKE